MSIWKVNTDSLNLRNSPEKVDGNIIRALPLAQEVKVLTGTPTDRWWKVETVIDGALLTGFVSSAFLRQPISAAKEILISASVTEWLRFKLGNGLETKDPYYKYVGEYWQRYFGQQRLYLLLFVKQDMTTLSFLVPIILIFVTLLKSAFLEIRVLRFGVLS
jgi:hypothetical protein